MRAPDLRTPGRQSRRATPPPRASFEWRAWIDFGALCAVLAACALGGGSSFADVPSLLYVRPIAVAALAVFALTPARIDPALRAPLWMLAALAATMAAQLIPLPPAVWTELPGRAPYAALAEIAGIAQPWRPLSLTPDLTANALAALVVPAAALLGFARLTPQRRATLVIALVGLCVASAVLGVGQLAGGEQSPLYLYRVTYQGFPVGFLSNRNHQAALLAIAFPALRVWTLARAASRAAARARGWVALGLGVAILPVILATGSRAGMVIAGASLLATALAFPAPGAGGAPRRAGLIRLGIALAAAALATLSWVLGRAASFERLSTAPALGDDDRFRFAPAVIRIIRDTFPAGVGFGGFDPVFRRYEPDALLSATFVNHAHDELLEIAMIAGAPGVLLLAAFLLWWASRVVRTVRGAGGETRPLATLGAIATGVLMAASLVDYPLHTPLMEAVFAIGCGWLAARRAPTAPLPG